MPLYRDGTITMTQDSKVITGTDTAFEDAIRAGDLLVAAGEYYEVTEVYSDTELHIDTAAPQTLTNAEYVILQNISTAMHIYLVRKIEEFLEDRHTNLLEMVDWLTGEVDGGPNSDGLYPLTDRYRNVHMVPSPKTVVSQTAEGQAIIATQQATAALASAQLAFAWASNPVDQQVQDGLYSSRHWAQKAMNIVQTADKLPHLVETIPITGLNVRLDLPPDRFLADPPVVIVTVNGGPTEVTIRHPKELVVGVGEVHTHIRLTFKPEVIGLTANVWVTGS